MSSGSGSVVLTLSLPTATRVSSAELGGESPTRSSERLPAPLGALSERYGAPIPPLARNVFA